MTKNQFKFVICIENANYPVSLEKRKIYESIPDADANKHGQIRVIDESGDDYLYPQSCFVEADLSAKTKAVLAEVL